MKKAVSLLFRITIALFALYMVITDGLFWAIFFLPAFLGHTKGWQKANDEVNGHGRFFKRMLFCFLFVILCVIVLAFVFRAK